MKHACIVFNQNIHYSSKLGNLCCHCGYDKLSKQICKDLLLLSNFKPIIGVCGGFNSLISNDKTIIITYCFTNKKWIIHHDSTIEVNTNHILDLQYF